MADFLQTDWPVSRWLLRAGWPDLEPVFSFLFPLLFLYIHPFVSFSPPPPPFRHLVLHVEKLFHTGEAGDNPS